MEGSASFKQVNFKVYSGLSRRKQGLESPWGYHSFGLFFENGKCPLLAERRHVAIRPKADIHNKCEKGAYWEDVKLAELRKLISKYFQGWVLPVKIF